MTAGAPPISSPADVAAAAQLACLLEVSAPKPGNVSPGLHFSDARYEHFLASAVAIGQPLTEAANRPLGATIRLAVESTLRWSRSNTNLGIVLMLAPLARAALLEQEQTWGPPFGGPSSDIRRSLRQVLSSTTIDDAREAYAAIRLARPGGLGRSEQQDVAFEPDVTLLEAMKLAADRDGIAREYASDFETTFARGVPALEAARQAGLSWDDAIVETFLTLLASAPDTHIARRAGAASAQDISRRALAVLNAGGVRSEAGRRASAELDRALRGARNLGNPGTTADLTAAAIFVVLLNGGWS